MFIQTTLKNESHSSGVLILQQIDDDVFVFETHE